MCVWVTPPFPLLTLFNIMFNCKGSESRESWTRLTPRCCLSCWLCMTFHLFLCVFYSDLVTEKQWTDRKQEKTGLKLYLSRLLCIFAQIAFPLALTFSYISLVTKPKQGISNSKVKIKLRSLPRSLSLPSRICCLCFPTLYFSFTFSSLIYGYTEPGQGKPGQVWTLGIHQGLSHCPFCPRRHFFFLAFQYLFHSIHLSKLTYGCSEVRQGEARQSWPPAIHQRLTLFPFMYV